MPTAATPFRWPLAILTIVVALLLAALGSTSGAVADVGSAAQPAAAAPVHVIPVRGAIGPATAAFVQRGLERGQEAGAQLIVLTLDTPGGLDTAMRDIVRAIITSAVPVAAYVYPGGARAASAGTYILYASHLAAMAPGTNLGAATPVAVGIGGSQPERGREGGSGSGDASRAEGSPAPSGDTMARKQMHDAAAYLRGLAQLRGRNADWAERAVRESVSLSATEAEALRVIDLVAADVPALLKAADGRSVQVADARRTLRTAGAAVVELEPDWRIRLLAVLTEPSVALILMMIGIYGLLFEFSTPGMVVPGVVGAICLLLGLFALQMLPINYAGLALIALGIGCMVAEAWLPSFGVLGLGGVAAFALGAVMLIDTDLPGYGVPLWLVGTLAVCAAALSFGISLAALTARKRPAVIDDTRLTGAAGTMLDGEWGEFQGERWRVHASTPLAAGQPVHVTGRQGLVLLVEPLETTPSTRRDRP
ncbi:nodulation protein NfeD [Cupriavidus sp. AU9028]|uniref:NfeD family protein n=1 Tax=Cupriavidus sp. AU9028 TaxID=2871157 RepID=UPI001C945827|nr:nodulation protein NfeD [Cupriavidus sp. AU9028]MBY4898230.1 nodulation protein NfeD [Cupriavidus sp. AU9028]